MCVRACVRVCMRIYKYIFRNGPKLIKGNVVKHVSEGQAKELELTGRMKHKH